MYFWSINRLVRDLGDRDLSEGEAFRYFLANWILLAVGFSLPQVDWNVWDVVVTVGTVAIAIAGSLLCFRANGGGAGTAFLQRFLAVFWVMTIRVLVFAIPLFVIVAIAVDAAGRQTDAMTWWDAALTIAIETLLYLRVAKHLQRIRTARQQLDDVLGPRSQ